MIRQTVFVLMDAFRWDYLEPSTTPHLHALASRGLHARRLVPSAGFCERSEIATGATPAVTGNFTAIGYDPENSPFRPLARWMRGLELLDRLWPAKKVGRKLAWRIARRLQIAMPVHRIPLRELSWFRLTEDQADHRDPGGLSVESLFDVLREDGARIGWHYTALGRPNGDDQDRLDSLERGMAHGADLHLVYLEAPDRDGHHLGPESREMRDALRAFDHAFGQRIARLVERHPQANFVLIGDHGMTTVTERLDVGREVERVARSFGWKRGRDYRMFLDSTLARWWFEDPEQAARLREALDRTALGRLGTFLDARACQALELPVPAKDSLYGEAVWWARPGVLVEPDAFHDRGDGIRGMHGYDPEHRDSQGTLIAFGDGVEEGELERVTLRDVCPTLCELLGVRVPGANSGISVFDRWKEGGRDEEGEPGTAALDHRLRVR